MKALVSSTLRVLALAICLLTFVYATTSLTAEEETSDQNPLVERDTIRLKQAGAQRALEAALAKAEEMKLAVNIAIVDDGGHLLLFTRMDKARPASVATAITKATTAALTRIDTGPLPNGEEVNIQLSLAIENAAAASGGKFTTLKGGVPLVVDGQIVGAIGVGGATGEQDQQIARAAAQALMADATKSD